LVPSFAVTHVSSDEQQSTPDCNSFEMGEFLSKTFSYKNPSPYSKAPPVALEAIFNEH